jgi:hypothetical protein
VRTRFIWTDQTEGALRDKDSIRIGLFTDERSEPLIVDKLRALDRDRQIEIHDPWSLRETCTYVISESGKMVAEEPSQDDCVISLAIAAHIHEGRWILQSVQKNSTSELFREYWMCSGRSCATSRTFAWPTPSITPSFTRQYSTKAHAFISHGQFGCTFRLD